MNPLKTTGHLAISISIVLALSLPFSLGAAEIELTTSNDLISGNQRDDDLYTSGLAFRFHLAGRPIDIGERMFTDRRAALRFDETYIDLGLEIPDIAGWQTELEVGLLRTGRGIVGERMQNQIHRWVGSDEVSLQYVDHERYFATAAIDLRRLLYATGPLDLHASIDAFAAPGFRHWLRARIATDLELGWQIALRAGIGVNLHRVSYAPLEPNVNDSGASWELGASYRKLMVRWTYNEMGTRSRHLSMSYRMRLSPQRSSGLRS